MSGKTYKWLDDLCWARVNYRYRPVLGAGPCERSVVGHILYAQELTLRKIYLANAVIGIVLFVVFAAIMLVCNPVTALFLGMVIMSLQLIAIILCYVLRVTLGRVQENIMDIEEKYYWKVHSLRQQGKLEPYWSFEPPEDCHLTTWCHDALLELERVYDDRG